MEAKFLSKEVNWLGTHFIFPAIQNDSGKITSLSVQKLYHL